MAIIDLTEEAVTITGDHFFLYYALKKAEEDHIALYEEIAGFDPKEQYPQFEPKIAYLIAFARRIFGNEVNIVLVASSLIEAIANMFYS